MENSGKNLVESEKNLKILVQSGKNSKSWWLGEKMQNPGGK